MTEAEEPSHVVAAKNQWKLKNMLAGKKSFKVVNGEVETYTPVPPVNDLETTIATAWQEEHQLQEAALEASLSGNADSSPLIGQMIKDRGIFIGTWSPTDRDGISLGKTFNMYAAPQDLTDRNGKETVFSYDDAVSRIAELKNWNGYDGADFINDKALYDAIKNDQYHGEWFIPTLDVLVGKDEDENVTREDSIYSHKDKGALTGTFMKAGSAFSDRYWSCEDHDDLYGALAADFSEGIAFEYGKGNRMSCRPVRLELRT